MTEEDKAPAAKAETGAGNEPLVPLQVDGLMCICIGQCEILEPELFQIDDDTAVAVVQGDGLLAESRAAAVIERCPTGAISIANPGPT